MAGTWAILRPNGSVYETMGNYAEARRRAAYVSRVQNWPPLLVVLWR